MEVLIRTDFICECNVESFLSLKKCVNMVLSSIDNI